MSNFPTFGLSANESAILSQWKYDPVDKRMSTDASVRSSLNSFELAEMHTLHSGGENVFTQNNVSGINWFPVWQGVATATQEGESIGYNPTVRQYEDTFLLFPNGAVVGSGVTTYQQTVTYLSNESSHRLQVVAAERYQGEIKYSIRGDNPSGIEKYKQRLQVDVFPDDVIEIVFTHPNEARKGDTIFVDIIKEDGESLLLRNADGTNAPWLSTLIATFHDIEVVSATRFITDSFTMRYSGDYEVDTSSGAVVITIPADFTQTFFISDANRSFDGNSCSIDFSSHSAGVISLNNKNAAFKYYYDGTNWHYKDLNTKSGGVV